ncbi:MAG: sugar ABC transporter permease, partial [Chloroflexi bacterium]|nr:sugar ABC transporter permease [Chloroflexota bacterium]
WALPSLAVFTIWKDLGFNVIVLMGGLQGIPAELHEAASIDGAGGWNKLRSVTVPMLSPSLFFLSVVSTISVLQTFAQVAVTTKGGPAGATTTIVFRLYREAFFNLHLGLASAIGILLFIFVLVLTLVQFRVIESRVHYQ